MDLFKVTFWKPERVFYVRATGKEHATEIACAVEFILEARKRPKVDSEAAAEMLLQIPEVG